MDKSKSDENKKPEWVQIMLGAVLAVIGGIIGQWFNGCNQQAYWEKQFKMQNHKQLFETRQSLIERTAKILNKTDLLKIYSTYKGEIKKGNIKEIDPNQKIVELREKMAELNSEFNTVISLNAYYFGSKSDSLGIQISGKDPWWECDQVLSQKYLQYLIIENKIYGEHGI
jgi:hypothetical protein